MLFVCLPEEIFNILNVSEQLSTLSFIIAVYVEIINTLIYYMKCSCITNGSKMRKTIFPSGDTIFINTCVISFLNQSAFSIFARFSMVRARGTLSRLLCLNRAKIKAVQTLFGFTVYAANEKSWKYFKLFSSCK